MNVKDRLNRRARRRGVWALVLAGTAACAFVACEDEGPVEEAGEEAGEAIEEGAEEIGEGIEEVDEEMDDEG